MTTKTFKHIFYTFLCDSWRASAFTERWVVVELLLRVMRSGCRVTAGHVNDATCVCDVEFLRGAVVQVKAPSGSYPLVPVTINTTPPPPDILTCTLPLWVRVTGKKKKIAATANVHTDLICVI